MDIISDNMKITTKFFVLLSALIVVFCVALFLMTIHYASPRLADFQIWEIIYLYTPAISVVLLGKQVRHSIREAMAFDMQGVKKFCLYAVCAAVLFPCITLFLTYLFGNIIGFSEIGKITPELMPQPDAFIAVTYTLVMNLGLGLTIGALFALGGEVAWRGFFCKYISGHSYAKNVFTGLIWGVWNIPLIVLHQQNAQNLAFTIFVAICFYVVASFLLSNILAKTHSILATAAIMGIINCSSLIFIGGNLGNPLFVGASGLLPSLSLLILNLLLFFRYHSE